MKVSFFIFKKIHQQSAKHHFDYCILKSIYTLLSLLSFHTVLAQGNPIPGGGGDLLPRWVLLLFAGIYLVGIIFWIVKEGPDLMRHLFRNFNSIMELVDWHVLIIGTFLFYKKTVWNFWWCLLAGVLSAMVIHVLVEIIRKFMMRKNRF